MDRDQRLELAKRYADMPDSELIDVAYAFDELTDDAQELLRDEFKQRRLEMPTKPPPEGPGVSKLAIVAIAGHPQKLAPVRDALQVAGIACVLENWAGQPWSWDGPAEEGFEYRVCVNADQEDAALQAIEESMPNENSSVDAPELVPCLQCASFNVVQLPAELATNAEVLEQWRCKNCGFHWNRAYMEEMTAVPAEFENLMDEDEEGDQQ